MNSIEFVIKEWQEPYEDQIKYEGYPLTYSMACLEINLVKDSTKICLTKTKDPVDLSTRSHVVVSLYPIALWLLCNWWRIRWEPKVDTFEWKMSHQMMSIGYGYIWPPLEFSNNGDLMRILVKKDTERKFSACYTNDEMTFDIPTEQFESVVDKFVGQVSERLRSYKVENPLQGIIDELTEERNNPTRYNELKEQAIASNYKEI